MPQLSQPNSRTIGKVGVQEIPINLHTNKWPRARDPKKITDMLEDHQTKFIIRIEVSRPTNSNNLLIRLSQVMVSISKLKKSHQLRFKIHLVEGVVLHWEAMQKISLHISHPMHLP